MSSPVLRGVEFKYQANEILAHSLTSTNFHTYYQGSEMVVAGRLMADQTSSNRNLIEYEILATEANGEYKANGNYSTSSLQKVRNSAAVPISRPRRGLSRA